MRALIIDWLMWLLWWAPLAALIVTSLGLVALKRISNLSPWLARLTAPPFYLVSLPIATLIVGAEMLGLYSLVVLDLLLSYRIFWYLLSSIFQSGLFVILLLLSRGVSAYLPDLLFALTFVLPIGFWAATFSAATCCGGRFGAKIITSHLRAWPRSAFEDCCSSSCLSGRTCFS